MNGIQEIPLAFGPDRSLLGVLSTPARGESTPIACLMLNAGATHRVGPGRIHVKLARQLAERGVSSLRMDLSGFGDSGVAQGAEHARVQAVRDLQAAMDQVESMLGIRRFVVIGLRSGAANALALAVADSRVVALSMFDGFAFPSRRSLWERRARQVLAAVGNPGLVGKTARWLSPKAGTPSAQSAQSAHSDDCVSSDADRALFRRSMLQLSEREIAVMLTYSGSAHVVDHDRDQLGALAHEPFMRDVDYRFLPDVDGNLTSIASQQSFMAAVTDWVLRVASQRAPAASEPLPRRLVPVERVMLRTA